MHIKFPEPFVFGTSTSAYQIETAFCHDWLDLRARDGHVFNRTTDHEQRHDEDVSIIASLAPHYRMSLMWSRLQRTPYTSFDAATTKEYTALLKALTERGVKIMMVIHHFANRFSPVPFAELPHIDNVAVEDEFLRVDRFQIPKLLFRVAAVGSEMNVGQNYHFNITLLLRHAQIIRFRMPASYEQS